MKEELEEELEEEIEEEPIMTTKQLISRLLEIDPDGNKQVYIEFGDDEYYTRGLDYYDAHIDDNNHNIIMITL